MASRLALLVTLALIVASPAAEQVLDDSNSWPFNPPPDTFQANALLDLRSLNEEKSGQSGFIKLSENRNDFVRGDGKPIRFWAAGSDLYRAKPEEMDRHCRFLAKMGVNLVRLHAIVPDRKEGAKITDLNQTEVDGIYRFIKAAKENGIYVLISPFYAQFPIPKSWDLPDYTGNRAWGAIFLEPKLQDAYKAWTKALYTTVNPHTGIAIKDDPTVAFLQVHNEDSLFFWTQAKISDAHKKLLAEKFGAWLTNKYKSVPAAFTAWGSGNRPHEHDNAEAGVAGVFDVWFLTQNTSGGMARRLADQTEFMATFQREFYQSMGDYLRKELGCKQLLNATNWRTANDAKLKAAERYTYQALDFDAENEYVGSDYQHSGENDGYRIDPGHFLVNESVLFKPFELSNNFKLEDGHPFFVTETSWKHPNRYQSEGPFLMGAYQSLTGLDAVFWFSCNDATWHLDPRRLFWKVGESHALTKWSCSTPMLMGMFPANALLYREGYLKQGEPVVREERPLRFVWQREEARINDNEIYGDGRDQPELRAGWKPKTDEINRAAFLAGPVVSKLGGEEKNSKVTDLAPFVDLEKGIIKGNTGEQVWNYRAGLCTVDAPKTQGVTGMLAKAGGKFALSAVTIESGTDYATIQLVSMDGKPLKESAQILLQIGTVARLTGWRTSDATMPFGEGDKKHPIAGERIVATGTPPWRIGNIQGSVSVANPALTKAVVLDAGGYPVKELPLEKDGDRQKLTLPPDGMYVILK